jgi:nucleoside-diphosphate-sugar epimerase
MLSILQVSWRDCNFSEIIRDNRISSVIFLAHGSHPRSSCKDTVIDFQQNTMAVMRALGEVASVGNQHVIFASSRGALDYDSANLHLQLESGYALGKLMAEAYLSLLAKRGHLRFDILRIPNPFDHFRREAMGKGLFQF